MAGGSSPKKKKRTWRRRNRKPNPAAQLTDDLLVEILSRVPYRSLCRFRCVSTHWHALISHPDHRRRLPQTLAGFFHAEPSAWTLGPCCFADVSGTALPIDPSFSFLPDREREYLELVDSCNGLLLCRSYRSGDDHEFDYLVLNPATEKWVAVPISWRWSVKVHMVRLGFDPAFSSHFHIFEFQLDGDGHVLGVKMYSSGTGVWIHKQTAWRYGMLPKYDSKSVFVNGVMHIIFFGRAIGTVDVEGKTWRVQCSVVFLLDSLVSPRGGCILQLVMVWSGIS